MERAFKAEEEPRTAFVEAHLKLDAVMFRAREQASVEAS